VLEQLPTYGGPLSSEHQGSLPVFSLQIPLLTSCLLAPPGPQLPEKSSRFLCQFPSRGFLTFTPPLCLKMTSTVPNLLLIYHLGRLPLLPLPRRFSPTNYSSRSLVCFTGLGEFLFLPLQFVRIFPLWL